MSLMCQTRICCLFILSPAQPNHLPRIMNCRWCACTTEIAKFFDSSDLYKCFLTASDAQVNLLSPALILYVDWGFSPGHMSMDLSSVLAALTLNGVPSVAARTIQMASPQGCTSGPAWQHG